MKGRRSSILRRLAWAGATLLVTAVLAGIFARRQIADYAVRFALELAGASEVKLAVSHASPWRVVLDDVGFRLKTRPFKAERVTFERANWWTPTLGAVRVERAWLPLVIDGSDVNPWAWSTYKGRKAAFQPVDVPADEISIDGTLSIQAAAVPEQKLSVRIEAKLGAADRWTGTAQADGPGISLAADAVFTPADKSLQFRIPQVRVELREWQDFVQRLIVLPGGAWTIDGVLTGNAEGRMVGDKLLATGNVSFREGRLSNNERKVIADGVEFDLEFEDFDRMRSKPGTVRAASLKSGDLEVRALEAEIAFETPDLVSVSRVRLAALGGSLEAEPFKLRLDLRELETVVVADGLEMEQILALAKDLPARATGRVDGRLPIRIDDSGIRFGTGWLELKSGTTAEMLFNSRGLLTGNADPKSHAYAVLQKVETGLTRMRITELRLDTYPPNRPPGRSAQLHIAGEPVDPAVKAPVTLDLNVNGPVEKLVNLGVDSRLKVNTGKK